jgi:hypothetical protein
MWRYFSRQKSPPPKREKMRLVLFDIVEVEKRRRRRIFKER